MGDVLQRKCDKCKGVIEIERDHISNVLQFQNKYYHANCFKEMATKKASSKAGKPEMWQDALDRLDYIEVETRKKLEHFFDKDELNAHILDHYNLVTASRQFWQAVEDLEAGKYRRKRCKPVATRDLCACWKWGQRKLDEIDRFNKSHNRGPTDDNERLMYDLAILIGKLPVFFAQTEKQKVAEREATIFITADDIDMSKIGQNKQSTKKDISDISDDLFVE